MAKAVITLVDTTDEDVEVKVEYEPALETFSPDTPLTVAQYLALQAVMFVAKQMKEDGDLDAFSDEGQTGGNKTNPESPSRIIFTPGM